jgi:putative Mg2+ transporter-C (MgtC) family protein
VTEIQEVFLFRLVLTVALGGLLGLERERKNKSAGLKTHILVSVSGCLLMWLSTYGFGEFHDHPNARFDPARLAAQVGGGIGGFLAAGVVLRSDRFALSGYSTAAMLLLAMIIGFAVGGGQYFVAITTVAVVLFCMVVIPVFERQLHRKTAKRLTYVSHDRPKMLAEVATLLGQKGINIIDIQIETEEGVATTTLSLMPPFAGFDWKDVIQDLSGIPDVTSVVLDD